MDDFGVPPWIGNLHTSGFGTSKFPSVKPSLCPASQGQPVVALAQDWVMGAVQFTFPAGETHLSRTRSSAHKKWWMVLVFKTFTSPFYFDFDPWRAKPPENWNIREEQARVKPNQSPSFAPVLGNHRYRTSSTLRHFCRSQGSCPKSCPNNRRTIRPCKHVPGLEVAAWTHALWQRMSDNMWRATL